MILVTVEMDDPGEKLSGIPTEVCWLEVTFSAKQTYGGYNGDWLQPPESAEYEFEVYDYWVKDADGEEVSDAVADKIPWDSIQDTHSEELHDKAHESWADDDHPY